MSPLGPFNEFYINKDDPFLADDFVIKNSFQDIRKREYENITATWDEIGKTLTSASLDIEDDALNNGLVFLQDRLHVANPPSHRAALRDRPPSSPAPRHRSESP